MRHIKNKKRIKDVQQTKDYNGEASPYWEHLASTETLGHGHGGATEFFEPFEANPDLLGEDKGLYYMKTDINEEQLAKVKKAIPFLTPKQQAVLQMIGYEGKTLENVGAMLGISKGNVLDLLNRARKIIKQKIRTFEDFSDQE